MTVDQNPIASAGDHLEVMDALYGSVPESTTTTWDSSPRRSVRMPWLISVRAIARWVLSSRF